MLHPALRLQMLETRAKRRFGQNFLVDPGVVSRIVRVAGVRPGERALEIGPGLGILTEALLNAGAEVTAIELDRDLAEGIREALPRVRLVEGDAMRVDMGALLEGEGWRVAANLPYNVATPILMELLKLGAPRISTMALMFQREVADRLVATPADDAFGALSVQVQARANVERALELPPQSFHPAPKVHSTVVRFELIQPDYGGVSEKHFDRVVRAGFAQRRKFVANSLTSAFLREDVDRALAGAGIVPTLRAERIDLPGWRRIAAGLSSESVSVGS